MALPTRGRVIVDTTVGEIDIELWSKETPKTCRNFIALAMEGYYDGVIFHRVVPGFLVQTGDRTGTGGGGESFYGEPFEDEIHPRLRFPHRGIVAMANNGTKNSNDSQFFITLDRAEELHGKHTVFGRVVGDTLYNVLKIGELELDENERPIYPPKIKTIRIIENPFDDIVPRITAEEKRAQQRAREEAQREREEGERRRGAKKDVKLLSFGGDEEEEEEPSVIKKKPIVRPDLADIPVEPVLIPDTLPPPASSSKKSKDQEAGAENDHRPKKKKKKGADDVRDDDGDLDVTKIRAKHAEEQAAKSSARQTEIEKMEAEIRKLSRKTRGGVSSDDEDSHSSKAKKPKKSALEEEMARYVKGKGMHKKGKKRDESDVLAALNSFRSRLKSTDFGEGEKAPGPTERSGEDQGTRGEEEETLEIDNDTEFLSHALRFPKDNTEEAIKAERDYEVIDPRQRGARAREEERERKKMSRPRDGGRGFRR
ncbi:cyclophilin-like protein [Panus rudis PR-1116 ss-1]|nr:cyclophilin-like protein [Panus rudis PR-1116 ss-1]